MKRPVKKVRRFNDGGYAGDDPIVKYRMGKSSEAETYDAMGQKDLADAARAKEAPTKTISSPTPVVAKQADQVIDMRDNKDNTVGSDVRERAMKFRETNEKEKAVTPKVAPVKTTSVVKSKAENNGANIPANAASEKFSRDQAERIAKEKVEKNKKTNYIPNKDITKDNRDIEKKVTVKKPDLVNGPIKGPKALPRFIEQQKNIDIASSKKDEPEFQGNAMKKGGKVAGKLATRGYGKAR